jgi:hypothetical protein
MGGRLPQLSHNSNIRYRLEAPNSSLRIIDSLCTHVIVMVTKIIDVHAPLPSFGVQCLSCYAAISFRAW